jgi:hypothetical protein
VFEELSFCKEETPTKDVPRSERRTKKMMMRRFRFHTIDIRKSLG